MLHRRAALVDFRLEAVLAHAGRRTLSFSAFRLQADEGELPALLLVVEDRTAPRSTRPLHPGASSAPRRPRLTRSSPSCPPVPEAIRGRSHRLPCRHQVGLAERAPVELDGSRLKTSGQPS